MKFLLSVTALLLATLSVAQSPMDTVRASQQAAIALQQQKQGAFMQSNQNYAQAAAIYKKNNLWKKYIVSSNQIARNYWQMHKLDSSLAISKAILSLPQLEPNSLEQAEAFSNTGVVCDMKSDYDNALQYFHKCLAIRKAKLGDEHIETGKVYYNMGSCYNLQRKSSSAMEYYNNSLRIFKMNLGEDHPFLINVYLALRDSYEDLGKGLEILELLKKALIIAEKTYPSGHEKIADIINSIGITYFSFSTQLEKGLALVESSFAMYLKIYGENHPEMSRHYTNMGELYERIKRYDSSEKYYSKAINLSLTLYGPKHIRTYYAYNGLAGLMGKQHKDSLAVEYAHRGMLALLPTMADDTPIDSIPDFMTVPIISIPLLVTAYLEKTFLLDELIDSSYSKVFYRKLYNEHLTTAETLINRAKRDIDNLDDQLDVLANVHKYSLRKVWYYSALDPEKKRLDLLNEMVIDIDKSKSMLLKIALTTNNALQFGGVSDSLRKKEADLKSSIQKMEENVFLAKQQKNLEKKIEFESNLFKLKEERAVLTKKIETEYPAYHALKYKNDYVTVKEIQDQLLDDSTMIIEYFQTIDYLYIYTITKNKVDINYLPVPNGFYDKFKVLRQNLTNLSFVKKGGEKAHEAYCQNAYYFYEMLIKNYVPNHIRNLILMPDKELNRLPFEAFLTELPKNGNKDYGKLSYLMNKYNIRYAYSAALLIESKQKQEKTANQSNQILAFAASYKPTSNEDGIRALLKPIPGALREVQTLKEQFSGKFYLGAEATEANFKNANFKDFGVVHLSMHGILDKKNPMNSSLAFTEDSIKSSKEDDFVHAYELTNMSIHSNLVVLSACETGDGEHQLIEGVVSIGRSFMYAGVPSMVMTLWQVNDYSTAQIMKEFYRQLSLGKTKSEALRQAKFHYINLVKNGNPILAHPYFWAAFISLGDDSNIAIGTHFSFLPFAIGGSIIFAIMGLLLWKRKSKRKEFA